MPLKRMLNNYTYNFVYSTYILLLGYIIYVYMRTVAHTFMYISDIASIIYKLLNKNNNMYLNSNIHRNTSSVDYIAILCIYKA